MKSKLDKMKRIERLQKRMHELARWKLTHMSQERERLTQAHSEMISALGEGLLSFGGAATAATRRIRSIEVEMKAAEAAEKTQAGHAFEQGMRSRAAERAVKSTSAKLQSEVENKNLAELIERSLGARFPGSGKP